MFRSFYIIARHVLVSSNCYFNQMSRSHAVFLISWRSSKYGKRAKLVQIPSWITNEQKVYSIGGYIS